MPFSSSTNRKVLKNSRIRFMGASLPPDPERRLHPRAEDEDPHQRHRNEYLPAETHDLVVAVARKGGAEPQERRDDEEELDEKPARMRSPEDGPRRRKR